MFCDNAPQLWNVRFLTDKGFMKNTLQDENQGHRMHSQDKLVNCFRWCWLSYRSFFVLWKQPSTQKQKFHEEGAFSQNIYFESRTMIIWGELEERLVSENPLMIQVRLPEQMFREKAPPSWTFGFLVVHRFGEKKTLRDNNKGHLAHPGGEPVVKLASIMLQRFLLIISKHILHENGAPPRNASFMKVAPFRETYASRIEPGLSEAFWRRARLRDRLRNASDNPGSYLEAHVSRTRCTTKKQMFHGEGTIFCNKRFEIRTMSIGGIK